jgi:hypothetical protein
MSGYADFIKNLTAIPFEKYSAVSSREKLVVYTISFLKQSNIPLTFNNICIATFKLFPDKFYFSEEFSEFPHIEMLNRTILHLRPIERNYAAGSVRSGYEITQLGEEVARQVKAQIEQGTTSATDVIKVMDPHKKTSENDLIRVLESKVYKEWLAGSEVDEMKVWEFFGVTPYTQIEKNKTYIKETRGYAQSKGESKVVEFLDHIKAQIL